MKKWTVLIFITIVFFLFAGCNERDLGDNYYYLPEYEAIDVGYPYSLIYKATQEYSYNDIKIQGNIVGVNHNDEFIIVTQRKDSTGVNNDNLQYYIIIKNGDLILGPYNKEVYFQKRIELDLPKRLTLK